MFPSITSISAAPTCRKCLPIRSASSPRRGIKEYVDKDPGDSMQVMMQSYGAADAEVVKAEAVRWCCYDVGVGRTCVRHN